MPWDINQINQAFLGQVLGGGPAQAFDNGRMQAKEERIFDENRAAAQAAAQRALNLQQQKVADQQLLAENPTPENYRAYFLAYPEDREATKEAWGSLSTQRQKSDLSAMHDLRGYLSTGNIDRAIATQRARIDADKAAGEDVTDDEAMLAQITTNPNGAMNVIDWMIASVSDPTKAPEGIKTLGENQRATELQPGLLRKGTAEATTAEVEAQYAPDKIESDLATAQATRERMAAQTANEIEQRQIDWGRLGLDQDALATNTQLKLDELHQTAGALDAGSTKAVNDAVMSAQTNNALADRAKSLADQFAASEVGGWGWASSFRDGFKGAFGGQDPVTALRGEYTRLINSQALKNLPPGAASDKDIEIARQGFPPPNAGKDYVVSFLRGMEKIQRAAANADDRRANWIAQNKSLGPARSDIDVGGVRVPAGTTFNEFDRNTVQRGRQGEVNPGVQSIINRYGGR